MNPQPVPQATLPVTKPPMPAPDIEPALGVLFHSLRTVVNASKKNGHH